jgi:hypothetical protein
MQFNQWDGVASGGTRLGSSGYLDTGSTGDVLQLRDVGGVGPHRSSLGGRSVVDMCPHPYASRKLTPRMNFTSSGSANANANAAYCRKQTAVHRALLPRRQRNATPPGPIPASKEAISAMCHSKTYLNGRALVPNTSTIEDCEVPGMSGEHAKMRDYAKKTTPGRFKSSAGLACQSKLGKRKANAAPCVPYSLLG